MNNCCEKCKMPCTHMNEPRCINPSCDCHQPTNSQQSITPDMVQRAILESNKDQRELVAKANSQQEWPEQLTQYMYVQNNIDQKHVSAVIAFIESLISQVIEDSFMEFLSAKQNNQDFTETLAYLRIKYLRRPQ